MVAGFQVARLAGLRRRRHWFLAAVIMHRSSISQVVVQGEPFKPWSPTTGVQQRARQPDVAALWQKR
jgi:hypothetical protein